MLRTVRTVDAVDLPVRMQLESKLPTCFPTALLPLLASLRRVDRLQGQRRYVVLCDILHAPEVLARQQRGLFFKRHAVNQVLVFHSFPLIFERLVTIST